MQQRDYIGFGSIRNLRDILEENNVRNIFLVTGDKSYESCGAKKSIEGLTSGYHVVRFHKFEKNPRIEDIEKGIDSLRENDNDIVIAIGGGSVIDMAKSINALSVQSEAPIKYVKKEAELSEVPKPLVAIPTTAGSGSESTHFAVIYINKQKYSLAHDYISPHASIVDPTFTMNLPKNVTASSGMDALSQAIESYWCVNSTDESKEYANEAIDLILTNLVETYLQPIPQTRYALAKAAHLAGKAINITKTTAAHAISYPFTSYFNIAHGHAVALTLGEVLIYNSQVTSKDVQDPRGVSFVRQTIKDLYSKLGATDAIASKEIISGLMHSIGLKTQLSKLGIHLEQEIELILDNINIERLGNNPRSFTRESLKRILKNIN